MIDAFARKRSIERNEAILELIEAGFARFQEGGVVEVEKQRSFEEFATIRKDVAELKESIANMRDELRLVHHTLESDYTKEAHCVPYQTKNIWDFLRRD
ncbi:type II secretion system protein E [Methanofollis fontis]|nr:type II secretion system protein E [Methanofollis fontis]